MNGSASILAKYRVSDKAGQQCGYMGVDEFRLLFPRLREHDIRFCILNGTLLGIVREGRLLPGDPDIDLAVWEEELPKVLCFAETMRNEGKRVKIGRYRGEIYKVGVVDPRTERRAVDICVFRRSRDGKHAWQICRAWKPLPNGMPRHKLLRFLRHPIWSWKAHAMSAGHDVEISSRADLLNIRIWLNESRFLDDVVFLDGVAMPRDYVSFLENMYGDWEIRRSDWDYFRDSLNVADVSEIQAITGKNGLEMS